jgi:hypothetical protein
MLRSATTKHPRRLVTRRTAMADWTDWKDLEEELYEDDATRKRGVYQVRIVNGRGEPIPIPRLGGVDQEAIYYVGQTGGRARDRLKDFRSSRMGGEVLDQVSDDLEKVQGFEGYRLEYRLKGMEKQMTPKALEQLVLTGYLYKFCELPPGNNNMPRKALDALIERIG